MRMGMTAELPIIQDENSGLGGRSLFFGPEVRFHLLRRRIIQTFADEYLVAADFDHHGSLFGHPRMPPPQGSPGIRGWRVFRNSAVRSQSLPLLVALRQGFRIHRRE